MSSVSQQMLLASAAAAPAIMGTPVTSDGSFATTRDVALPAGIVAGEKLLILGVNGSSANRQFNTPAGWSSVAISAAGAGNLNRFQIFERTADGSDGSSVTILSTGNQGAALIAMRLANVTSIHASSFATASTATPDPPSLTPPANCQLWIAAFGALSTGTITSIPAGYTPIAQMSGAGGYNMMIAAAFKQVDAGTQDPPAFALSTSSPSHAVTIAIG